MTPISSDFVVLRKLTPGAEWSPELVLHHLGKDAQGRPQWQEVQVVDELPPISEPSLG